MESLTAKFKDALRSPLRVWSALAVGLGAVALLWIGQWAYSGRGARHAMQRWSDGGNLQETRAFAELTNHPQDLGLWQERANERDARSGSDDARTASRTISDAKEVAAVDLDYSVPRVSVYSVPNVKPPHAHPTLRDLGDRAQVRAIEAIEREHPADARPWDDLQKALADQDEAGEKDPFLFERVLVATVAKGTKWPPGDRMVWTRIFVQPINFKFAAYTIASTESETVKVSSVEATNVRKLSADVALTIPGIEGPKLTLAPSHEDTVKTTSDISTQYERLGVDITSTSLRIMRESAAGGDVNGNTTVALSLTTDPDEILTGSKAPVADLTDISLVVTGFHLAEEGKEPSMEVVPLVPLPHCPLMATIWTIYEQRHIQDRRWLYEESRQTVGFIHDVDEPRNVEIMGADDASPFVWSIQIVPPHDRPSNKWPADRKALSARFDGTGPWRQLLFSDYGRAVKLAHWVRTSGGKEALSRYHFNYVKDYGLAVIKQTQNECKLGVLRPTPEDKPLPVKSVADQGSAPSGSAPSP